MSGASRCQIIGMYDKHEMWQEANTQHDPDFFVLFFWYIDEMFRMTDCTQLCTTELFYLVY